MNYEDFKKSFEGLSDDECIAKMIKESAVDFHFVPIPHWIKCSKGLPPEGQTVICYNGMVHMGFYQEEYCPFEKSKQGWNIDFTEDVDEYFREQDITHWMPLPAPPD